LRNANANSQNNTFYGTTWYKHSAFGYGKGKCIANTSPAQPIKEDNETKNEEEFAKEYSGTVLSPFIYKDEQQITASAKQYHYHH
jgi:hypothetical protein